jgi:hypothetical protein
MPYVGHGIVAQLGDLGLGLAGLGLVGLGLLGLGLVELGLISGLGPGVAHFSQDRVEGDCYLFHHLTSSNRVVRNKRVSVAVYPQSINNLHQV